RCQAGVWNASHANGALWRCDRAGTARQNGWYADGPHVGGQPRAGITHQSIRRMQIDSDRRGITADLAILACALFTFACRSDNSVTPPTTSRALTVIGAGAVNERYTAEIWVLGNVAYTT